MARCLRKVEHENFYIVFCNTVDRLFPFMFESAEAGHLFIEEFDKDSTFYRKVDNLNHQGNLSFEDLKGLI